MCNARKDVRVLEATGYWNCINNRNHSINNTDTIDNDSNNDKYIYIYTYIHIYIYIYITYIFDHRVSEIFPRRPAKPTQIRCRFEKTPRDIETNYGARIC